MFLSINREIVGKPSEKRGHGTGFNPLDLTPDQFIEHIKQGHAYSAQFRDGKRRIKNFQRTGFLAVDIDHGSEIDEVSKTPFVTTYASFIHTTASHAAGRQRFRIVFELEEPITDPTFHRAAMSGLIATFGGDVSTKDPARMYYGNVDAEVVRFNKRLPVEQVHALAAISNRRKQYSDGVLAKHAPVVRTNFPFGPDHLVKLTDNSHAPLCSLNQNDSIYCPFHLDAHPSAFVVRSTTGTVGIHCQACAVTSWPTAVQGALLLDWHIHYQREAERIQAMWWDVDDTERTDSHLTPDGTAVTLVSSRFLPDFDLQRGITFIRSPKGSGKTEQLAKLVNQLRAKGKTILLVGHRRLLLSNLAKRLGIASYLKRTAQEGADLDGCLAVSLESLYRYVIPSMVHFDAIIIDESEQVVSHFTSKTMAKMRVASRALLELLMKRAEYVVCSDADMGLLTSGLIYLNLGKDHPDHLVINHHERERGLSNGRTNEISVYEDDGALLDSLMADVRSNKRCFVATNSKRQADRLQALIKGQFPDKQVLLITSSTSPLVKVKRFIKRPSMESLQYEVLICSPALSTGIDITFPNDAVGFDAVYGFFMGEITTHFELDQQLSRVRNPGKVCVWISPRKTFSETDPIVIRSEMIRNRDMAEFVVGYTADGQEQYSDDAILDLYAWVLSLRRSSLNDLKTLFIALRQANGWTVKTVEDTSSTRLRGDVRDNEIIALISGARDLNRLEYDEQSRGLKSYKGVTSVQLAALRRFEIKDWYGVEDVSPDLVTLDDEGRFRQKFSNLKLLNHHEKGIPSNPGTLDVDRGEVRNRQLASPDWSQLTRKKKLLIDLLTAAGIYLYGKAFDFEHGVSKKNLANFIVEIETRQQELKDLFDVAIRADCRSKPVIQLREVLKLVGLTLTKKSRVRKDRSHTDNYWLDRDRWNFIVSTCGMHWSVIEEQTFIDQVEL